MTSAGILVASLMMAFQTEEYVEPTSWPGVSEQQLIQIKNMAIERLSEFIPEHDGTADQEQFVLSIHVAGAAGDDGQICAVFNPLARYREQTNFLHAFYVEGILPGGDDNARGIEFGVPFDQWQQRCPDAVTEDWQYHPGSTGHHPVGEGIERWTTHEIENRAIRFSMQDIQHIRLVVQQSIPDIISHLNTPLYRDLSACAKTGAFYSIFGRVFPNEARSLEAQRVNAAGNRHDEELEAFVHAGGLGLDESQRQIFDYMIEDILTMHIQTTEPDMETIRAEYSEERCRAVFDASIEQYG